MTIFLPPCLQRPLTVGSTSPLIFDFNFSPGDAVPTGLYLAGSYHSTRRPPTGPSHRHLAKHLSGCGRPRSLCATYTVPCSEGSAPPECPRVGPPRPPDFLLFSIFCRFFFQRTLKYWVAWRWSLLYFSPPLPVGKPPKPTQAPFLGIQQWRQPEQVTNQ